MAKAKLNFHPVADIFPMISGHELDAFRADIKRNGVRDPVVFVKVKGKKLYIDGRNRLTVAAEEGLDVPEEEYTGEPERILDWVLSRNLQGRRHLTPGQRAACAIKGWKFARESGIDSDGDGDWAENLANQSGSNRNYIFYCKTLVEEAPHLLDEVISGRMSLQDAKSQHARESRPAEEQGSEETERNGEAHKNDDRESREETENGDSRNDDLGSDSPTELEQEVTDAAGEKVPPRFKKAFEAVSRFDEAILKAKELEDLVKTIASSAGGEWLEDKEARGFVGNLIHALKSAKPHMVCPDCTGSGKVLSDGGRMTRCTRCDRNGFVNEARFKDEFSLQEA